MGKPFDRHARLFVLPVSTVLADQKAPIRAAGLSTLTAIATACEGVECMVAGFTTALETQNPLQKGTLLQWMTGWFNEHEAPSGLDLNPWASLIVSSLDDRNSDVRKGAQALLPTIISCAGFDYVMQQTNALKPASRTSAIPIIQAARPIAAAPAGKPSKPVINTAITPSISPSPESPTAPPAGTQKLGAKSAGVRRKLPQGTSRPESRSETPIDTGARVGGKAPTGGSKKPGGGASSTPPTPSVSSFFPFSGTNVEAKKARTGKDAHRWINEGGATRKDLADLLQSQMEPCTSKELVSRLFSRDHNAVNDHVTGLTTMQEFFSSPYGEDGVADTVRLASFDLPLKYISIKAHEPQPNLISKCLDVVEAVLGFLRSANHQFTDQEAICFVPTIIYKVCHPLSLISNPSHSSPFTAWGCTRASANQSSTGHSYPSPGLCVQQGISTTSRTRTQVEGGQNSPRNIG